MGYYTCPRCGSNESYEGTEMVSEYKPGVTHYLENAAGHGIARQTGGTTKHTPVTATKCKACGELLGDKDFRLTKRDIADAKKKEDQQKQEAIEKRFDREQLISCVLAIIFFIMGFYNLPESNSQVQKESSWPALLLIGSSIGIAIHHFKRKNQHYLEKYKKTKTL
jgi:hypothetical protein